MRRSEIIGALSLGITALWLWIYYELESVQGARTAAMAALIVIAMFSGLFAASVSAARILINEYIEEIEFKEQYKELTGHHWPPIERNVDGVEAFQSARPAQPEDPGTGRA